MLNGLMKERVFIYSLLALVVCTGVCSHDLLAYAPGEAYYTGKPSDSDAVLQKKVEAKIMTGWFSNYKGKIMVQVENGRVTLQGHVKTEEDKKRIEAATIEVNGVKSLDSQLIAPKTKNH